MINSYSNLPKVSDFDSLLNQEYKTNYCTDQYALSQPTCHLYDMDLYDKEDELYLDIE